MLTSYIEAALRKAKYKLLGNKEGVYGEIPGFAGLWARAQSLEQCREELRSTLESWIVVKLRHNDNDLPTVGGISLNQRTARKPKVA